MAFSFRASDIAELTVGGAGYHDWKTVYVYLCYQEANNFYRFTCSEGRPLAQNFAEHRIRPGDFCTVTLGGQYAIGGRVTVRQVAYTATHHGVEITGKGETYRTVNGAAVVKGGELTNVTYQEMASKLLQPYGLSFEPKGAISQEKFPRVNVQGQSVWEVLDSHARARNIILGPSPHDNTVMWGTDPNFTEGSGSVEEGVNILEGREIISQEFGPGVAISTAQMPPTPANWGAAATQISNTQMNAIGQSMGLAANFMPLVSHLEIPGGKGDAEQRSGSENTALSPELVKVEVVVQGWFRGGDGKGGLWMPWDSVFVKSPMLIMNEELKCKSVTFTQDDRSGSRTTLELVRKGQMSKTQIDLSGG